MQSAALGRAMKYRVLLPADYATSQRRYAVLYLLHGLGGDYKDWTTRTNLAEYSRTLPLIIVMPDGENSWYTNAANAPEERFEDYILTDLQADVPPSTARSTRGTGAPSRVSRWAGTAH